MKVTRIVWITEGYDIHMIAGAQILQSDAVVKSLLKIYHDPPNPPPNPPYRPLCVYSL